MGIIVTTNESITAAPEKTELAENNSEVNQETSESVQGEEQDETTEESETSESEESLDNTEESEDEHDEEKSQQDEKPKKKGGFKKRIERFQRKLSVAEQELAYWKEKALKENSKAEPESKTPAKTETNGKPKVDDFATYEEYTEALTDWKIEQREKERDSKARETQVKTEYQKQVETFQSKVSEFAKTKDDFEDVISEVDDVPLSLGVSEAITSSENGPELMYELAKNKKELMRINALSPILAAREIGKIEARLAKTESKPIPKTTKAPAPISPVGNKGSATIKKSIYDPNLSQADYERLMAEREKRK